MAPLKYYSYFDHPMTLIISQPFITIWPRRSNRFNLWNDFGRGILSLILFALSKHENFERWGNWRFGNFGPTLNLWNRPFSAQLLSLVMIYSVFHVFIHPKTTLRYFSIIIAILLQFPLHTYLLIVALLGESILRTELSFRA